MRPSRAPPVHHSERSGAGARAAGGAGEGEGGGEGGGGGKGRGGGHAAEKPEPESQSQAAAEREKGFLGAISRRLSRACPQETQQWVLTAKPRVQGQGQM